VIEFLGEDGTDVPLKANNVAATLLLIGVTTSLVSVSLIATFY
jgi:hypothetical protein